MKKLFTGFIIVFLALSVVSQTTGIMDVKVPRAGEFIQDYHPVLKVNEQSLKGEDGYDSLMMTFQGNWPFGTPNDIISSITGDTVFIAAGGGVMIMDITDPATPQPISEVRARALVDHCYYDYTTQRLYLAAYFSGVEIWDLSDITNPVRISRIPTDGLSRGGVYAHNDYLYIIMVTDGMLVYDITDPANPVYKSTASISGYAWNFYAEGNFIYVQTTNAIRLYDISNPETPVLRDSYGGSPTAVYVKDNYCYISEQSGLVITDVSNPDDITFVGSIDIPGASYDVVVIDDYAYVANHWWGDDKGGVYTVDVSDPTNPVQTDHFVDVYLAITGVGDKVAAVGLGYAVFNIPVPGQLELSYEELLPGFLTDVAIKDNFAYTGSNGFRVFDVTDISNPQQVAYVDIKANALDISGNILAYIPESMGTGNRLSIMDISDPVNAYEIGHYSNMQLTQDAIIQGNYVFVGNWWDGFTIIDISDPSNPSYVTKEFNWNSNAIPGEEWCYVSDLDVEGNYLYVIDYKPFEDDDTKGLYIFDISDIENPVLVKRYQQQSQKSWRIKVQSGYVYLADAYGGIEVIDVTNPTAPQTVAYLELMDVVYNLDIHFGYVYAACYILGGVQAINVSVPVNPVIEGYYYPSGVFALNVTAYGNDIYVADGTSGFQIYNHDALFTGIDKPKETTEELYSYPNPSAGIINLKDNDAFEVVVFDEAGRLIKKIKINKEITTLNLTSLPNGVYFLKFKTDKGIKLNKLVIFR
jgi:hypothetical protein